MVKAPSKLASEFIVGGWVVRPGQNTIGRAGVTRRLEPRVMDLLAYFAGYPGEVLSHDRLIQSVWPHVHVTDSALQSAIFELRKAFGDDSRNPGFIETIPKRGYRLVAESTAARPVLAVLPFQEISEDESSGMLAGGLTDGLVAMLGGVPGIRVLSRHSVVLALQRESVAGDIVKQLDVTFLVDGSVQRMGDKLRISVQLVDAENGINIWGNTYDTNVGQFFATQQTIARDVGAELAPPGITCEGDAASDALDPEAVDHYLRGRFHWYKLDPTQFGRALEHFEAAVNRSPEFGAAYAGIADVWGALGYWGAIPARESGAKTRAALDHALAAGLESPELSMLEGAYRFYIVRDWASAREHLDESIAQNPDLAHAYLLRSLLRATLGDDGAQDDIAIGRRLDPLNPAIMLANALCLAGSGKYAGVKVEVDSIREINPSFGPALELRADLAWLRKETDAVTWERPNWRNMADAARILETPGAGAEMLGVIAEMLERRPRGQYVSPVVVARLRSLSGQPEAALDILEQAAGRGDLMKVDYLALAPAFEAVRRHPRYRTLAGALGLPG